MDYKNSIVRRNQGRGAPAVLFVALKHRISREGDSALKLVSTNYKFHLC